jgi:hypothetical protein
LRRRRPIGCDDVRTPAIWPSPTGHERGFASSVTCGNDHKCPLTGIFSTHRHSSIRGASQQNASRRICGPNAGGPHQRRFKHNGSNRRASEEVAPSAPQSAADPNASAAISKDSRATAWGHVAEPGPAATSDWRSSIRRSGLDHRGTPTSPGSCCLRARQRALSLYRVAAPGGCS